MIEFSCLYVPQDHYFISTYMKYRCICKFLILSESPSLVLRVHVDDAEILYLAMLRLNFDFITTLLSFRVIIGCH